MARQLFPNSPIMVFARDGISRALAREHGAHWAGDIHDTPPAPLNAAIDTTPVWRTVLAALEALVPGGRLVINAIRKEEADKPSLLQLDYPKHLWLEKEIKSVTNVTRADVADYLLFAVEAPVTLPVQEYALEDANRALEDLKFLPVAAAKVLVVS
jgi:propanol-preferring alcohol dehydrogenase